MTAARRPPRSAAPPYSLTSRIYDQVYAWKDYGRESRQILRWVRKFGPAGARTLLDVACGSGNHLAFLSRHFESTGLDSNEGMLRAARRKLPRVRFVRGRMETFRVRQRFDVITCLFSAIGYVRSVRDLRRTVTSFAAHLTPGGVAIVEPWLTRAAYRPGSVHVGTYGDPKFPIVRMNLSEQRGNRSIMNMHHLVGTPTGVLHWVEHHDLGMFEVATYLSAFRAAGFRVRYLKDGLMPERGVYVAVLPAREPASPTAARNRGGRSTRGSSWSPPAP